MLDHPWCRGAAVPETWYWDVVLPCRGWTTRLRFRSYNAQPKSPCGDGWLGATRLSSGAWTTWRALDVMPSLVITVVVATVVAVRGAAVAPLEVEEVPGSPRPMPVGGGIVVLESVAFGAQSSTAVVALRATLAPCSRGRTVVWAPRPRVFTGARNESVLTAESSVSLFTQRLPALDQALGRGAAAPAAGCRLTWVALGVGASLLRCS